METELLGAAQGVDFSIIGLFLKAGPVVQGVMLLLAAASVWSWAVAIDKWLGLRRARRAGAQFEESFWSGRPLDELYDRVAASTPRSAHERVFAAGMAEFRKNYDKQGALIPGARERIERALDLAVAREGEDLASRVSVLASIGAVAPFIGLFGTVWGIMSAFQDIAAAQNTNLATVAPGIAEALFATALGLIAAVPAVIFYNWIGARIATATAALESFADEFALILSRQIMRSES